MNYKDFKTIPYTAAMNAGRVELMQQRYKQIMKYDAKINQLLEEYKETHEKLPSWEGDMRLMQISGQYNSSERAKKTNKKQKLTQQQCERLADQLMTIMEAIQKTARQAHNILNEARLELVNQKMLK